MAPAVKPALRREPDAKTESGAQGPIRRVPSALPAEVPRRFPNVLARPEPQNPLAAQPVAQPSRRNGFNFQPRIPVLQGEASYRGWLAVDGIIAGHLGATGSTLTIKQRPKNGFAEAAPELDGEITFKDMLRVNGHIAGRVFSQSGTLIIDAAARVDACIDVAVAVISGTVYGNVIGRQRVELSAGAIVEGNISTRSLSLKPGAVFDGECRILKNENGDQ